MSIIFLHETVSCNYLLLLSARCIENDIGKTFEVKLQRSFLQFLLILSKMMFSAARYDENDVIL